MTTTIKHSEQGEDFTTSKGLRHVLVRLHEAGPASWEHDPTAGALVSYAADKYAGLARKHGLDPWEAASAAFEAMRNESTRTARDPWAVVTRAVQITCVAEERGQGLLCSTHQARRRKYEDVHDPERMSDRETPLSDYHPSFHVYDHIDDPEDDRDGTEPQAQELSALNAVDECVALFTGLGWPPDTARTAIHYVTTALSRTRSRMSAYEALRHDKYALAFLDLTRNSWAVLLHALLGNPHPALQATPAGRGILMRLVIGEPVCSILHDEDLILSIALAAPGRAR
ncbi:hypothetical protein I6I57_08160 [Brevibacterium casei]|jgi:hypothetical protein|uniref:hypothetical protein n=1 Tax=Brevibacterium casei TaxID=33889 RepID=UPI001917B246|nr:hypothetical protein [Brevibacterium casei]QQT70805.1 hypothetical protein I6I57_08160 [Brevibacterium casei]